METNYGIYVITNMVSGKVYIGSTTDVRIRRKQHIWALRKGNHDNSHLQRSWNKYGEDTFEFGILEYIGSLEELVKAEQFWMDIYREEGTELYNFGTAADNAMRGHNFSEEHRRKIGENTRAAWARGAYDSEETRCKFSKVHKGKKLSEETKQNISRANTGKVRTEEQNRRNSETSSGILNPNYGKVYTEEERARMSKACSGRTFSDEHCLNLSIALMGHLTSKETRQKMSQNMMGNKRAITKLTEEDVIEIRCLYAEGVSQKRLSELYPVCYANIGKVVQRLTWKHV